MKETEDSFGHSGPLGICHPGSLSQEAPGGEAPSNEGVNKYKGRPGTWETRPRGDRNERESSRPGPRGSQDRWQCCNRRREHPDQGKQLSQLRETGIQKKKKKINRILKGHLDNGEEFKNALVTNI